MIELEKQELEGLLRFNQKKIALYIYSPFCGTCKVATKMLEVALETLPKVNVFKCNLNHVPSIAQKWEVTSVPCLIIMDKNKVESKIYAMKSVTDIYQLLYPLQNQ